MAVVLLFLPSTVLSLDTCDMGVRIDWDHTSECQEDNVAMQNGTLRHAYHMDVLFASKFDHLVSFLKASSNHTEMNLEYWMNQELLDSEDDSGEEEEEEDDEEDRKLAANRNEAQSRRRLPDHCDGCTPGWECIALGCTNKRKKNLRRQLKNGNNKSDNTCPCVSLITNGHKLNSMVEDLLGIGNHVQCNIRKVRAAWCDCQQLRTLKTLNSLSEADENIFDD